MDNVEREREKIRKLQAKGVMLIIGPLLDAWDDLPNDVKCDPELERVAERIRRIDDVMEVG